MLQVLVAGLIALASKWLLDGGIRRRDRHVIREELELADLLGKRPEAEQLRASAERRLERYLRPPFVKRAAPLIRDVTMFVVAVLGAAVALAEMPSGASLWGQIGIGVASGAITAAGAQLLQAIAQRRQALNRYDKLLARRDELDAEIARVLGEIDRTEEG